MKGKAIILTGYMGCGKTTISKILAEKTGKQLMDSDAEIEREQGISINEIFKLHGEAAFREMETELLRKLVNEGFDGVLSCGGGMPLKEENRELLKQLGTVFYLKTGAAVIAGRLKGDGSRPLLNGLNDAEKVKKIEEMLMLRSESYEKGADHVTDTDGLAPDEVASCILGFIHI